MNYDPRFALTQELVAQQNLLDQIRSIAETDQEFFIDILEGETNLVQLFTAVDRSVAEDEILIEGAKTALDKLQNRKRAAENRIDLKRRLLTHAFHEAGIKSLRTPTATLSIREAGIKAIVVATEEVPSRYWKAQPPKLDQEALTKAVRAREKALHEAEAIVDAEERQRALAAIDTLHPPIPGVAASNGGVSRRMKGSDPYRLHHLLYFQMAAFLHVQEPHATGEINAHIYRLTHDSAIAIFEMLKPHLLQLLQIRRHQNCEKMICGAFDFTEFGERSNFVVPVRLQAGVQA
jgi:hypothetical protein